MDHPLTALTPQSLEALVRLIDAELAVSRPQDEGPAIPELDVSEQLIRFAVGECVFAVAADQMAEIDSVPPVTFVPHLPSAVCGLANLRGEVITVIDLARFLDSEGSVEVPLERRMIVVRDAGRGRPGGIIVDRVFGIHPYAGNPHRAPADDTPVAVRPFVVGGTAVEGEDVAIIDLSAVARTLTGARRGSATA